MSNSILKPKMAASDNRKTVKYKQIPFDRGIFGIGVTSRFLKWMSNAILKSKMVGFDYRKTGKYSKISFNRGIFGIRVTSRVWKLMSNAILKSNTQLLVREKLGNNIK